MHQFNINRRNIVDNLIPLSLVALGTIARFLPHLPNFSPIAAMALFGGVYLPKRSALILPVIALLISDIFLGLYQPILMIFVYSSFLLCAILGLWINKHKKWYTILGSAVIASCIFYIFTNFAVWAFTSWYVKTLAGLIECYVAALPFFRNTLIGDIFYVSALFGAYELIRAWFLRKSTSVQYVMREKS